MKSGWSFVGNAIFIPFSYWSGACWWDFPEFFIIWLGDPSGFAFVMTGIAMLAKWLAAYPLQKSFNFSIDERRIIFGLSPTPAAATLEKAFLIGSILFLGTDELGRTDQTAFGKPILEWTIVMNLVTMHDWLTRSQKRRKKISQWPESPARQHQ